MHVGAGRLAVRFGFDHEAMPHDRIWPGDSNAFVRERELLVDRLFAGDSVDHLLLGLEPPVGMAEAQLLGKQRIELLSVGIEIGLVETCDSRLRGLFLAIRMRKRNSKA